VPGSGIPFSTKKPFLVKDKVIMDAGSRSVSAVSRSVFA